MDHLDELKSAPRRTPSAVGFVIALLIVLAIWLSGNHSSYVAVGFVLICAGWAVQGLLRKMRLG